MTPDELKRMKERLKISFVELAARTGLPSGYIQKIFEGDVIPLVKDVIRIENAALKIEKERQAPGEIDDTVFDP